MADRGVKQSFRELIVPLPRMSLKPPLAVQIRKGSGEPLKFFGYAVNLTREGLFVSTMKTRPVGSLFLVCFSLPRQNIQIEGQMEVVWVRDFDPKKRGQQSGMGLRFLNLSEDHKRSIDQFMGVAG